MRVLAQAADGRDIVLGPPSKRREERKLGPLGFTIPNGEISEIPDALLEIHKDTFQELLNTGDIAILSYGKEETSAVVQGEANQFFEGLYAATIDADGDTATASPEAATLETAVDPDWNLQEKNLLRIQFDGLGSQLDIEVALTSQVYDQALLISEINGSELGDHLLAAAGTGDKVAITAKSLGANSQLLIVEPSNPTKNANDILQFPASDDGVGTAAAFEVSFKTPANQNSNAAKVVVGVYDAATNGALVGTSTIQRVSKGSVESGLYSNEAVLLCDQDGELDFEVADTAGATVHVEVAAPEGYFLASTPASRSQVN